MKAKDLKNSILQMAVEGKLVPQDPSDEPASVLLERIREEKHRLIAEGKAKFPKGGESIIYIGSDGSPYEKRVDAKGHVLSDECIAGEVPFEKLPEGWAWVRLTCIMQLNSGLGYKKDNLAVKGEHMVRVLRGGNIGESDEPLIKESDVLISATYVDDSLYLRNGQIITPAVTSLENVGKAAIVRNADRETVCGGFVFCLTPYLGSLYHSEYLHRYLTSPSHIAFCKSAVKKSGQAFYNLSKASLNSALVAIPPLAEQHRIVERIDQLMPLVEGYGRFEDAREKLDAALPDRLRKSVLQMAVQGKLVPQDSADEPASALLERIREQRRELIKQKKMKAPKGGESIIFRGSDGRRYEKRIDKKGHASEPVCIEDEIPFEIPDSWEWARLEALGAIVGGGTPQTGFSEFWSDEASGVPWITPADMSAQSNILVSAGSRFISNVGLKKSSAQLLPAGSVLMSSRAPIGYLGIAANPIATNQGFKSVVLIDTTVNYWLICVLEALMDSIVKRASGTTFKEISGAEFGKTLIPLPPIGEQTRILGSCRNLSTVVTNQ